MKKIKWICFLIAGILIVGCSGGETSYSVEVSTVDDETGEVHTTKVEDGEVISETSEAIPEANSDEESEKMIEDVILLDEKHTDMILNEYFESMGDNVKMQECFLPYALGQTDLENFEKKAGLFNELVGDYMGFEAVNAVYISEEVGDMTILYWGDIIKVNYSNMSLLGDVQIATQDNALGISFAELYPEPVVQFFDTYIEMIKQDDIEGLMNLYSERFYNEMEMTPEEWLPNIEYMVGDMSNTVEYELTDWDYMIMPLSDGTQLPILGIIAKVDYNGKFFQEQMIINFDGNEPMILLYKISAFE